MCIQDIRSCATRPAADCFFTERKMVHLSTPLYLSTEEAIWRKLLQHGAFIT